MKPLTNDEFKKRCIEIYNGKYIYDKTDLNNKDEKGRVMITCPIHGDFAQYPYNHLRGVGCPKCCNNTKKSKYDVIGEIKSVHGEKYIIPQDFEYLGNKSTLHMICPTNGDFYPTYYNFVKRGCGCKKCSCHVYEKGEFIDDLKKLYADAFLYDETDFKSYRKEVAIKCSKCGKIHNVLPKTLLNGHFKCDCVSAPYTVLEEIVANKLNDLGIKYVYQFKDKWLKNKNFLSVDFYLPELNIGIECQGRFHFEPYKYGDEKCEENFIKQKERDLIKFELCKKHNINLLYFSDIKVDDYFCEIYNSIEEIMNKITILK